MAGETKKPNEEKAGSKDVKGNPDTIFVTSGREDKTQVVLWERDDRHPNGEAFVDGNTPPVEVARTGAVMALLGKKDLIEVPAADAAAQWDEWKAQKKEERFNALVGDGYEEDRAAKISGFKPGK